MRGHVCGRREIHTEFWWGNLKEIWSMEDLKAEWWVLVKRIFKKHDGRA
jgi:hypothetical protein